MPLTKQTLSLKFEKGLNQKASDRTLNVPEMADIQNARFEKTGELRRRHGLTPEVDGTNPSNVKYSADLSAGTEFTKCEQVVTYKDELLLMDGKNAYAQLKNKMWVDKGPCDPTIIRNDVLRDDASMVQSRADLAYTATGGTGALGLLGAAYYEVDPSWQGKTSGTDSVTYKIYVQLYDYESMQEFGQRFEIAEYTFQPHTNWTNERAYAAPRVRLFAIGDKFVVIYNKAVTLSGPTYTTHVRYRVIDTGTASLLLDEKPSSTTSLLATGKFAAWDACPFHRYASGTSVDGIAIFHRVDTGTNAHTLQEYFISGSDELTTSAGRSYNFAHSSYARNTEAFNKGTPNPYGYFVRHLQPRGTDDDTNAIYSVGFNVLDTTVKGKLATIDAAGGTLSLLGSVVADPDNKGILNGSMVYEPPASGYATHCRVYYTTLDDPHGPSGVYPVRNSLRSMRVQLSDGAATEKNKVGFNTGLVSDPWVFNEQIYYTIAETISPKAEETSDRGTPLFSTGATYVVRDTLDDTSTATYKRERAVVVAKTLESDVAATPYVDWFHLNNDFPSSLDGALGYSMYWGCSPVIQGPNNDQRYVGCSSYIGQHLTGDQAIFSTSLLTVSHKPRRTLPSVEHNEQLLIGGGFLKSYAGHKVFENGFLRRPQISNVITGSTGDVDGVTGRMESGTYYYRAVYEYIDEAGNLHRSAPSDPISTTIGGSVSNAYRTIKVYNLNHSLRHAENVRIVLYRTLLNQTNSFRVESQANSFDSLETTFNDIHSDADLFSAANPEAAHEMLYTPGQASNGSPGSITDVAIHKNRVVLAQADDRVIVTKPTVRTLACEPFPEQFFTFTEIEGGTQQVFGIESTGDHLVIFSKNSLYAVSGEGPDATGGGSRFSGARLLTRGQGAVEGTIHENTPAGIIYQALRGIYLLKRDLTVDYIGAPVEDLGTYRAIGSLTNDERHEVYVVLGPKLDESADYTGYSTILVFNYLYGAWTQYTYDKAFVGYNSPGAVLHSGDIYLGRMRYASSSGRSNNDNQDSAVKSGLWKEDTSSYWDQLYGSPATYSKFSTVVESPYIHTNNLQGAQRVYKLQFLGEYLGDHDITVNVKVDYDDSSAHSQTKTASELTDKNIYRVHVKRQRCRALKVTHTIAPNSSSVQTNGLFKLAGMALEVGFRPTTFKLPKGDTI